MEAIFPDTVIVRGNIQIQDGEYCGEPVGVDYVEELVKKITTSEQKEAVDKYIQEAARKSELERTSLNKEKTGVFTGH